MQVKEASVAVIAVIVLLAVLAGITSDAYLENDNVIEQECEHIIEAETGVTVDLSP